MAKYILTDTNSLGISLPNALFLREDSEVTIRRINLSVAGSTALEVTGLIASCVDQWKFAHLSHDEQISYIEKNGFRSMRMEAFASLPDDLSDVVLYIAESTDIPDDGIIKCWRIAVKGVE